MKIIKKDINIFNLKLLFFILLFIFMVFTYIKKKKIRVCLCVIGKNENLYAIEYVNHYKKLGYNHIYIYDNNNIDGEKFSDILLDEIKKGFISIIDYIGYRGDNNNPQKKAYYDCYKKNKRYFDWLSFFDFDEFLDIKNKTIQDYLDNEIYKKCENIKINWLNYNSEKELLYYNQKPLQIRFKNPIFNSISNKHIKSTVRGKMKENYWSKWMNPHSSANNFTSCSSSGRLVESITPFIEPPDYEYANLKHFWEKSFEEFCYKLKRGWPDPTDNIKIINNLIKDNQNNIEKINIIKKVFNISKFPIE